GVWAALLDRVVLLDAPEPVLTSRIRGRHKPADVFRQMTDGEIRDLVARYRVSFERVLDGLARAGGPPPVTLATTATTPVRLGDAVLELLAERSHVWRGVVRDVRRRRATSRHADTAPLD